MELKILEHEPTDLDGAVKLALRFEVFRQAVESSSLSRHRINRRIENQAESETCSSNLESRLAFLEQQMERPARDNVRGARRNRAAINQDQRWDEMMERLRSLETSCKATEERAKCVSEENNNLSIEIGRLKHLE